MPIRLNKIHGFIRIYDRTRYLTLFGSEKYNVFYSRIRYLRSLKSSITYVFSHYYAKIKVDSYDSFLIEKRLTLNNVISKLDKTKNCSKYLIGYLDKVIRPLVLIIPEMIGMLRHLNIKMEIKIKTIN